MSLRIQNIFVNSFLQNHKWEKCSSKQKHLFLFYRFRGAPTGVDERDPFTQGRELRPGAPPGALFYYL